MQLTGYLVEYLIIGSTALLWILPLLRLLGVNVPEEKNILLLLAPTLYVGGMVIDATANLLTLPHRRRIRLAADTKYLLRYGLSKIEHATVEADLLAKSPELAREAASNTSRARVARGTFLNLVLATPVLFWNLRSANTPPLLAFFTLLAIAVAATALWLTWARWQRIAFRFEIKALSLISKRPDA